MHHPLHSRTAQAQGVRLHSDDTHRAPWLPTTASNKKNLSPFPPTSSPYLLLLFASLPRASTPSSASHRPRTGTASTWLQAHDAPVAGCTTQARCSGRLRVRLDRTWLIHDVPSRHLRPRRASGPGTSASRTQPHELDSRPSGRVFPGASSHLAAVEGPLVHSGHLRATREKRYELHPRTC